MNMRKRRLDTRFGRPKTYVMAVHLAVSIALGCSFKEVDANVSSSAQFVVACGSNSSVRGYSSIAQLNAEMRRDSLLLALPESEPKEEYIYQLCPGFVFDGSQQMQIPPQLFQYNPTIKCGESGSSTDSCVIDGGVTQVFMMDNPVHGGTSESSSLAGSFDFHGLTFTNSQDISVAALMSSPQYVARFVDCHWRNPQGTAGILVANYQALSAVLGDPETVKVESQQDNIFHFHRELARSKAQRDNFHDSSVSVRSLAASPQETASPLPGMSVLLTDCSFEHSFIIEQTKQMQNFILVDNHGGRVEVRDSTIITGGGILVVNVVNGGHFKAVNTSITSTLPDGGFATSTHDSGWNAIATIRSYRSEIILLNSSIQTDHHAVATLAAVEGSEILVTESSFVHTIAASRRLKEPLSQILVLGASKATITNTCFEGTNTATGSTVVVDNSSFLEQSNNGVSLPRDGRVEGSLPAIEDETVLTGRMSDAKCTMDSKSNDIWVLDSGWACLEESLSGIEAAEGNLRRATESDSIQFIEEARNSCSGTCQMIPRQAQCAMSHQNSTPASTGFILMPTFLNLVLGLNLLIYLL